MPPSTTKPSRAASWSRRKMLALLAGAAVVAVLLAVGLALAVLASVHPNRSTGQASGAAAPAARSAAHTGPSGAATSATGVGSDPATAGVRDALADASMPQVDDAAAQPGPVSTRDPGPALALPAPTVLGPVDVPTGFPRTPLGAMAQLAEIDRAALQPGRLAAARAVITGWALPGGPTPASWSGVAALAGFLQAAGLSGGGSPQLGLVVSPQMGLIKGTAGAEFVVPCLDFEVDATLAHTARVAVADCQRMVWTGQRWMIGPGPEPAEAPSVWPDTDTAVQVGYRDVRRG
jgi:hypothetical protein